MEWQKYALIITYCVVLYRWIPHYIQRLGFYEDVYSHAPGPCEYVEGPDAGSEDIQTLPDGTTFISSGLAKMFNSSLNVKPGIYLYNLSNPETKPHRLSLQDLDVEHFIPHGISVYRNKQTGLTSLFVVNHHPEGDRVEQFLFFKENLTLVHQRSFIDNRITQANDVLAVSDDSFYYTNYLYSTWPLFKQLELFTPMQWGAIFFWKAGSRPQLMVNELKQPNGITASKDKKLVYVAHEGLQELLIFRRQPNNSLILETAFPVNTSIDNLSVSPDGQFVWLGSHAVFWKMARQLENPEYLAPSQVLRLRLKDGTKVTKVTEVYADDGTTLKGSSSASYFRGKLLIGTVFHKLMLCDLSHSVS